MVQGKCTECTHCNGFLAQWYRPALCSACFHTIAVHFPGEWNEEKEPSTGKIFFTHTNSGERLFARPAELSSEKSNAAVARVRELARQHQQNEQGRLSTTNDSSSLFMGSNTSVVTNQLNNWSNFLDENKNNNTSKNKWGNRPPPLTDLSSNLFADIDEIHGPLLGSTENTVSSVTATSSPVPGNVNQNSFVASPNRTNNHNNTSLLNKLAMKSTTQLLDDDSDDETNKGTNAKKEGTSNAVATTTTVTSPTHTTFIESEIPTSPTAVSLNVINSLSLDLGELSRKLGLKDAPLSPTTTNQNSVPVSPLAKHPSASSFTSLVNDTSSVEVPSLTTVDSSNTSSSLPLTTENTIDATVSSSFSTLASQILPPPPPSSSSSSSAATSINALPPHNSTVPLPLLQDTLLPASPTVNHAIDSTATTEREPLISSSTASSSTVLTPINLSSSTANASSITTPVNSPKAPESSSTDTPIAPADLAIHLAPIYDDPLIVDVRETAFRGTKGQGITNLENNSILVDGVSVFPIQQPAEESLFFPRYLIVTPFTVMAVAPHPTRLGKGILKWERSILCLADMITQPLFTKLDEHSTTVHDTHHSSDILFDSLPYDHARASSKSLPNSSSSVSSNTNETTDNGKKKGLVRSLSKSVRNFFDKKDTVTAAKPTVTKPTPPANIKYRMHGIGLLASFVSETPETISFLRSYRAGRRPTVLQGWLYKRKRNAWREKAPLGPLAWKKRWFVLESNMITYYASSTPGIPPKGTIPLMGWVEVTKAGPDSGLITASLAPDATSRPHSFVVRTGNTYHVFQANNAQDAEQWCSAIAINAQYVGANQDEPQCIILPSHADAENLSKLIAKRREDLLSSMNASAILSLPRELTVDLSASLVTDSQVRSRLSTNLPPELLQDNGNELITDYIPDVTDEPSIPYSASTLRPSTSSSTFSSTNQYMVPLPPLVNNNGLSMNQSTSHSIIGRDNYAHNNPNKDDYAQDEEEIDDDDDDENNLGHSKVTVAEAEALIEAMGGEVTDEILQQLPPSVARKIAKKYQKQKESTSTGLLSSSTDHGVRNRPTQRSTTTTSGSGTSTTSSSMTSPYPSPLAYPYPAAPYGSPMYRPVVPPMEQHWIYLDDNDTPQGPFPDSNMRSWLWARYFGPDTLVRCTDPLSLPPDILATLPPNTVDARQIPQLFLPLAQLFPEPSLAFTPNGHVLWPNSYCAAVMYQGLLASALELGLDRQATSNAVALLQMHQLPADMSLVLDIIETQQKNANGNGGNSTSTLPIPHRSSLPSSSSSSSSSSSGTGTFIATSLIASSFLG